MTTFQSFDELYPGRFLKAGLFNGQPVTYTISDIDREELEGERGTEPKIVVSFKETPLKLVLAKINAVAVKAMFGAQVPEWIGKRVTLYGTTSLMPMPTRKDEPCIRVWGSPDIKEEVRVEWTPPRRKQKVVQVLKPVASATLEAALARVETATSGDDLAAILKRAGEVVESGKLTQAEYERVAAAVDARALALAPPAPEATPESVGAPEPVHQPAALSLADKRKLKAQIEGCPPAKQQAIYRQFAEKFNVPASLQSIQNSDHASYITELLTSP